MANRVELIYSIKELLKNHTDDSLISSRHILYLFNNYRAKYLRQLYSRVSKELDESAMQTLCLGMELAPRGVCGITTDCTILKSKNKLPNLLGIQSRSALVRVRPAIVGSTPFDIIESSNASSILEDKYATTISFIEDGYIYVVGKSPASALIKCIRVTAIFDDPNKLDTFNNCCGCTDNPKPVIDDNTEYPIPGHLLPLLSDEVLKIYLTTVQLEQIRDTENDSVPGTLKQRTKGK